MKKILIVLLVLSVSSIPFVSAHPWHVSNAPEIRELYGLPRADPVAVDNAPATPDNANGPRRSHRISGNKATMDVDDTAVHKGNTAGMHASNRSPQIEGAR